MASNKIDARQSRLTSAQGMLGSLSGDTLDTIFPKINDEIAKLFEDRNALLTDGGIITFTGTALQFTESLKISLNSKIDGSVQVFDLGSTTRSLSASGRMIYAVINRTAGTATVTADATALPAVTAANQEVFLIAKRVDATDGTQRVYFRNGSGLNAGQSVRLGASGTGGSGSGTGDDLNALTFKASFTDVFEDIPTASTSAVDTAAGKTDATLYSAVNALFQLNYDASQTVTGTGTSMTLSGTPSFTVKVGDILIVGLEARRITTVTTQTSYTIESAFTTDPSAAQATVSQAVYSKDLNNFAGDGLAISTAFSSAINQIMAVYEDTSMAGDKIFDANTTPVIGFSASSDGTTYSPVQTRPTNLSESIPLVDLPSAGTNLFLRFFANKTSGSGTVNVLGYKVFLHRDNFAQDGSQIAQSYGLTNGAGTEINIVSIGVVGGKTRIKKTWSYPVAVNPGTTNGALKVYLNGQKIPRFVDSTITPDASYREIDQNTIELDQDYSSLPLSIEIVQDVAVVDASDTNTTNISQIQETSSEGFQAFVKTSSKINATTTTGTPAAGTFYSSIVNRSPMPDLTQDLRARFGVNRVQTQLINQIQNEMGPNGEAVFGLAQDPYNQFRAVGNWASVANYNGAFFSTATLNDFVEITFYGTGLNIMANYGFAYDVRASVDGGSEGSNLFIATGSSILITRNYAANQIIPAVSGLALGVHTVKIRNNNANGINFFGYEIINDTATIRVNPGVSYVGGRKSTSSVQSAISHNSVFESGIIGSRGGRVVVYQKADGSIAKAVNPAGSQLNLTSADHSNEEIARIYSPREFGASRADDFSSLGTTNSTRAFTLDDGVTTLAGSGVQYSSADNLSLFDNASYMVITFVGTGLDIVSVAGGGVTLGVASVDGTSIGNYVRPAVANGIIKIVSGLPYGTHTVRLTMTAGGGSVLNKFIVYQPKKPSVPSGAVELADYNAVGTYSASPTVGVDAVSTGVVRKSAGREVAYIGTWGYSLSIGEPNAVQVNTTTNGDYFEYTFFGTGIEIVGRSGSGTNTMQVRIDGALYTGAATAIGSGATWTPGTSTYLVSASTGAKLQISGLTLGQHTIRLTKSNVGDGFNLSGLDVIAPINVNKSVTPYDQQNTLTLGNQSISDNRNTSPVKDVGTQTKNVVQAVGVVSAPSVSSTAMVPMPDMSVVHSNTSGKIRINFNATVRPQSVAGGNQGNFQIFVDGIFVGVQSSANSTGVNNAINVVNFLVANVSPGIHKVDIYWSVSGGTVIAEATQRILTVEEA